MCSRIRLLVAIALLSAGAALTSPGHAQTTNPSSEAIVKALTPTGTIGPSSRHPAGQSGARRGRTFGGRRRNVIGRGVIGNCRRGDLGSCRRRTVGQSECAVRGGARHSSLPQQCRR